MFLDANSSAGARSVPPEGTIVVLKVSIIASAYFVKGQGALHKSSEEKMIRPILSEGRLWAKWLSSYFTLSNREGEISMAFIDSDKSTSR
jgi:hypothetical protein